MNTNLQAPSAEISVMAQSKTTFMTLPPELRERVYKFIALGHTTRRIQIINGESASVTTSAIAVTCRIIFNEYEHVARKNTMALVFTARNMDLNPIIAYFHRHMDPKYLAMLQRNKATIHVNLVIRNSFTIDLKEFHTWALFLIGIKLDVAYHSDRSKWMDIYDATDGGLLEQCVIKKNSPQTVRDNIEEIRKRAKTFDKAVHDAPPYFYQELRDKRYDERIRRPRLAADYGPRRSTWRISKVFQ